MGDVVDVYATPTDAMANAGGGGAMTLHVSADSNEVSQWLATMIKKYTRVVGGGDVQVAFGRNS